jgi:hypothetical protein
VSGFAEAVSSFSLKGDACRLPVADNDKLLPNKPGRWGVGIMARYHAYFDESGKDSGRPVIAFGGYLFKASQASRAQDSWRRVLCKYNLPYFHMVDCAHNAPPFKQIGREKSAEVARLCIEIIKKHARVGCVNFINPHRFIISEEIKANFPDMSKQYSWVAIYAISRMFELAGRDGRQLHIDFYFESGNIEQAHIARQVEKVLTTENPIRGNHTGTITFSAKGERPLTQAADLLVWQATKHMKRLVWDNAGPRKDFASLMGLTHEFLWSRIEGSKNDMKGFGPVISDFSPVLIDFLKALFNSGEEADKKLNRLRENGIKYDVVPFPFKIDRMHPNAANFLR